MGDDKVTILIVNNQPAKLLEYETILSDLGESVLTASTPREAFEKLLGSDIAVVLVDVRMPELDGFELARLIRDHPRFHTTAIIFSSETLLTDADRLRAYEMGAVDYVPAPIIPKVLRAKVKVFVELYRKTHQLEALNRELESRVAERTAELEASNMMLLESEQRRSLALKAGQMGSWHWNIVTDTVTWDQGQYELFGVGPDFVPGHESIKNHVHPDDWPAWGKWFDGLLVGGERSFQMEYRVCRPDTSIRWCIGSAVASFEGPNRSLHVSGVTIDITDRKEAEERQALLAREVDHRAKNALALVQSIVRLTRADNVQSFASAIEGRISALSRAHTLLAQSRWQGADLFKLVNDEITPYRTNDPDRVEINGEPVSLHAPMPQTLALAIHELATNAAKYGALSVASGKVAVSWQMQGDGLMLLWEERGGPKVATPSSRGFGLRVINSSIEQQLGGHVEFEWRRDGLRCRLLVPLDQRAKTTTTADKVATPADHAGVLALPRGVGGKRVMVVEDEALIALMTAEYLTEIGYSVVGPFRTTAEAMSDATTGSIDIAILDVNLGGEFVYSVADVLSDRKIPMIFTTGYGSESIDARYAAAPILNKPIQFDELRKCLIATDGMALPAEMVRDARPGDSSLAS